MNAFETQIQRLYDRGLVPEKIAETLGVELVAIKRILGIVDPPPAAAAEVEQIFTEDEALALDVLRQVAKDRRAPANARVSAAVLLLDEKKGRREIAAKIAEVTGAAHLNAVLQSLRERRESAYKVLDVKVET